MRRDLKYRTTIRIVSFWICLSVFTTTTRISIAAPNRPKPIKVGMVALLASPQKYNGKVIQTIGFLHIDRVHEGDSLWLHKEDAQLFIHKHSFALGLSNDQRKQFMHLNHTYVLLIGTLRSYGPGGTEMDSGTIVHITDMDGWQPYRPSSPATRD